MIEGHVSDDGVPLISVEIDGRQWPAIVDTGFNGDLELPEALRGKLNEQPAGRIESALAGGHVIEEDAFEVEFPFDNETHVVIATFVADAQVLIGTNLLSAFQLQIKFASKTVRLQRE